MFLAGLGLPSQLENEDFATLLSAQARHLKAKEDAEAAAWQNQVRRTFS